MGLAFECAHWEKLIALPNRDVGLRLPPLASWLSSLHVAACGTC